MEILGRIPSFIAAVCITIYWGAVIVKLVRLARKIGKDPNAMPREPIGQLMRVLWYPIVFIMLAQAWIAALGIDQRIGKKLGLPSWLTPLLPQDTTWFTLALFASIICIAGTIYTFVCWRKMGRSWRIGIDPNEKLDLISSGPYRFVRHPIYAIRMVIDLCAWIMIPTPIMALTAAIDILLMQVEARREEKYMEATHGEGYRTYKKNVGRFVPRMPVG